ncbi:hypothetical protein AAFP35_01325 [Gordonia sp. CPCC 206044]|uniref:hypothetical protein n=1 Tax=Gordonia sp. CPCC 206044 TaxID=3140793 RepID=UPI003AF3E791
MARRRTPLLAAGVAVMAAVLMTGGLAGSVPTQLASDQKPSINAVGPGAAPPLSFPASSALSALAPGENMPGAVRPLAARDVATNVSSAPSTGLIPEISEPVLPSYAAAPMTPQGRTIPTTAELQAELDTIVGPSTRRQKALYLESGTRALPQVEPITRTVRALEPLGFTYLVKGPVTVTGSTASATLAVGSAGWTPARIRVHWVWKDDHWVFSDRSSCALGAYLRIPCRLR